MVGAVGSGNPLSLRTLAEFGNRIEGNRYNTEDLEAANKRIANQSSKSIKRLSTGKTFDVSRGKTAADSFKAQVNELDAAQVKQQDALKLYYSNRLVAIQNANSKDIEMMTTVDTKRSMQVAAKEAEKMLEGEYNQKAATLKESFAASKADLQDSYNKYQERNLTSKISANKDVSTESPSGGMIIPGGGRSNAPRGSLVDLMG